MRSFVLAVAIFLAGCGATPQPSPEPTPTVTFDNLFICDNLRAGATVEAVVEWEKSEGVPLDEAYPNVEQAVNETCPEFEILLQDYEEGL